MVLALKKARAQMAAWDHIQKNGPGVEILARLPDGKIVAARQQRWLATCFHPELVDDDRLYRLFLNMINAS